MGSRRTSGRQRGSALALSAKRDTDFFSGEPWKRLGDIFEIQKGIEENTLKEGAGCLAKVGQSLFSGEARRADWPKACPPIWLNPRVADYAALIRPTSYVSGSGWGLYLGAGVTRKLAAS